MRIYLENDENIEIGFAPLIDCVFLLLIFFLVATSFQQQQKNKDNNELLLELPTSSASFYNPQPQKMITLGVDATGKVSFQGEQITIFELRSRLRQLKNTTPNMRIRLDGDKTTQYQHIVKVLDMCQFEGFTNIGIHTKGEGDAGGY